MDTVKGVLVVAAAVGAVYVALTAGVVRDGFRWRHFHTAPVDCMCAVCMDVHRTTGERDAGWLGMLEHGDGRVGR